MNVLSLACVTCFLAALALFTWRANPNRAVNQAFAGFTAAVVVWTTGITAIYSGFLLGIGSATAFVGASVMPRHPPGPPRSLAGWRQPAGRAAESGGRG